MNLPDHGRSLIRHGDVDHAQLHALGALVAIDRERSCDMQRLPAVLRQCVAELRQRGVTPHVAQNTSGRRSAILGTT